MKPLHDLGRHVGIISTRRVEDSELLSFAMNGEKDPVVLVLSYWKERQVIIKEPPVVNLVPLGLPDRVLVSHCHEGTRKAENSLFCMLGLMLFDDELQESINNPIV